MHNEWHAAAVTAAGAGVWMGCRGCTLVVAALELSAAEMAHAVMNS